MQYFWCSSQWSWWHLCEQYQKFLHTEQRKYGRFCRHLRQLVLFSVLVVVWRVFLDISSVTLASSSLGNGNLINWGFAGVCEIIPDSALFFSGFSLEHFVWCLGQSFIWQLVLQYQLFLQTLHTNKGGFSLQFKHKWPLEKRDSLQT